MALSSAASAFRKALSEAFNRPEAAPRQPVAGAKYDLGHGDVVIAAITSCTNTSNPNVMMGAGLVARKAVKRGLKVKPWVKTSLAPGSQVVTDYLKKAGLQAARQAGLQPGRLWLHHLHRQFRPAARCDRRRHHRGRSDRLRGAFGQPQFRRPRPSAGPRQLSRLAHAGGGLCAGRLDEDGSDEGAGGQRQEGQAGLSRGHLAQQSRDRRNRQSVSSSRRAFTSATPMSSPATPLEEDRRLPRARPISGIGVHLCEEPALFRRHAGRARGADGNRKARACWRCSATASPPITSRPPATSRKTARPGNISWPMACRTRISIPMARAAAITK